MASVRGFLNIQSLNELSSEKWYVLQGPRSKESLLGIKCPLRKAVARPPDRMSGGPERGALAKPKAEGFTSGQYAVTTNVHGLLHGVLSIAA
jgi:hypothetical protein